MSNSGRDYRINLDNAWQEKQLVRLNYQLLKMERQRGYTRVERAYTASATDPPNTDSAANISRVTTTTEPGIDPINWEHEARRLLTAMRTMESNRVASDEIIDELQQQIRTLQRTKADTNHWTPWDTDNDHSHTNNPANTVPDTAPQGGQNNAVQPAQTQAKLAKELIKLANTYKVPELTFAKKAI